MNIHIPAGNSSPDLHCASTYRDGGQLGSLLECARTVYRHRITLLWCLGAGLLAGALLTAMQPRMYRSQAAVQIQGVNENFLSLRDIYPTAAPGADNAIYIQTQAEILQQDSLIEQVVRKLGLEQRRGAAASAGLQEPARTGSRSPVEEAKKNLQIVPTRGSSIIRIVCQSRDPKLAADFANTLADTFIEQNIEARQRSAQQTYLALNAELKDLRQKLLKSEGLQGPQSAAVLSAGGPRKAGVGLGLSGWVRPYSALEREVDGNRQFYEAMLRKADEASVAATMRQSNIRLVGAAYPASRPYKPNLPFNLAVGAFGSLLLGAAFVMLREQTNSALRTPGEAGAYLTLPELGAIPRMGGRRLGLPGFLNGHDGKLDGNIQVERATLDQPSSGLSESFRATLASILSTNQEGAHPRILVVTSSRPMEGKTTVVSNLGIALAEIGHKVLLIDGDLRRPRLHKVFGEINSWGLSDVLREKNAIEDLPLDVLVKKTAVPRLSLLASGTCADNIFGLLCSGRMARLFPRFREEFDYVLVDAPPCLEFADARIMARYSEKLLLVVRADYTDRRIAQAAVQRLQLDGIPVMGVIFNYWDPASSDSYDYARYRQELK